MTDIKSKVLLFHTMIITTKDTTGLVANNLGNESCKLGIKASGWAHLSTILRDSLYSDKILAPIREYSTNAMDAHVEAGKPTRSILVKLPNSMVPTFAVRDYGFGMSEDRIWEVFANYGESTKRNSNEQTGMLGIGSKSAFAYTDNFTIVNYHRGVKSIFMCHVAGSAEGDLVRVSQQPTVEEDGLEIQIPVAAKDIDTWISKAKQFFSHWKVVPIFEGNTIVIDKVKCLFESNDWYITEESTQAKVLMGNICYPIDKHQFDSGDTRILDCGIVFKAQIGDVDIAASREGLQYTNRTIKYFLNKLQKTKQELTKLFEDEVAKCVTNFEKKLAFHTYNDYYSKYYRFNFITANIISKFGGNSFQLIDRYGANDSTITGVEVNLYQKSRRGARKVRANNFGIHEIQCRKDIRYILLNDTDKQYLNRIAALIERSTDVDRVKMVYTLKVVDKVKFAAWKNKVGFDIPLVAFDTLPVVKTSELYGVSSSRGSYNYNPKSGKKVFLVDRTVNSRLYSDYYTATTIDKTEKSVLYVVIENWFIKSYQNSSPTEFVAFIDCLEKVFNIKVPKIVAVRPSAVEKLNSQFVTFQSYLDKLFSDTKNLEVLKKITFNSSIKSLTVGSRYDSGGVMSVNMFNAIFKSVNEDSFVDSENLVMKLKEMCVLDGSDHQIIRRFVMNKYVSEKEITDYRTSVASLLKQLIERYPLLGLFDEYQITHSIGKGRISKLVEYVNFVDGNEKVVSY